MWWGYKAVLLIAMIFFHIADDYYLQGFLAQAKQKSFWEKNYPDDMYKRDYITALITHAFSWTCSIHIPVLIYCVALHVTPNMLIVLPWFVANCAIHALVDNLKANCKIINLTQDQLSHLAQIVVTWLFYIILGGL